jgi:hypothetical protein
MTKINHDFCPIITEDRLAVAIEYVATSSLALVQTILQRELTIDTICFFAHTSEEYDYLLSAVRNRGAESKFSHGSTTYVKSDFIVAGQHIRIFGVRQPDQTRPWVGYGDYPITGAEYSTYKAKSNPYIHEITSGRGQYLLQFEHPDFDVLGFAFREEEH